MTHFFQQRLPIDALKVKAPPPPTHHVYVADTSGSMSGSLRDLAVFVKNEMSLHVAPQDTVSLIYFSGRGQAGIVFEGVQMSSLQDRETFCKAVDRWLKPMGLTGFVDPLKLALEVRDRLKASSKLGGTFDLKFMTDGYDNQSGERDILEMTGQVAKAFDAVTFLEYGWYCNRPLLTKMAELASGTLIFSENYVSLEENMKKSLSGTSARKISITLCDEARQRFKIGRDICFYVNPVGDIVITPVIHDGSVLSVQVPDGVVSNLEFLILDAESDPKNLSQDQLFQYLWVAVSRMLDAPKWALLKILGDVRIIRLLGNCFSKQDYSAALEAISGCIKNPSLRFLDGFDPTLIPDFNAFTVLDAARLLSDGENFIDIDHKDFNYQRTSVGTTARNPAAQEIEDLKAQIQAATNPQDVVDLAKRLAALNLWEPRFVPDPSPFGVSATGLVFNEERPNVSVMVERTGTIAIHEDQQKQFGLPDMVTTKTIRNYTLIRDGILNVSALPCFLDRATWDALAAHGLLSSTLSQDKNQPAPAWTPHPDNPEVSTVIWVRLDRAPLINRNMVSGLKSDTFIAGHIKLQELKALQKVVNGYVKDVMGLQNAQKLAALYGDAAAAWLSSVGIRDYGFSPLGDAAPSGDVYMAKKLSVSFAGASSLPSLKDLAAKVDGKKKLNLGDMWMLAATRRFDEDRAAMDKAVALISDEAAVKSLREQWLVNYQKGIRKAVSEARKPLTENLYAIIVGQSWFQDRSGLDDDTTTVTIQGIPSKVTFSLKSVEIEI